MGARDTTASSPKDTRVRCATRLRGCRHLHRNDLCTHTIESAGELRNLITGRKGVLLTICRRTAKKRHIGNTALLAMKRVGREGSQNTNLLCAVVQFLCTRYVMLRRYPTVSRRCDARHQVPTQIAMQ